MECVGVSLGNLHGEGRLFLLLPALVTWDPQTWVWVPGSPRAAGLTAQSREPLASPPSRAWKHLHTFRERSSFSSYGGSLSGPPPHTLWENLRLSGCRLSPPGPSPASLFLCKSAFHLVPSATVMPPVHPTLTRLASRLLCSTMCLAECWVCRSRWEGSHDSRWSLLPASQRNQGSVWQSHLPRACARPYSPCQSCLFQKAQRPCVGRDGGATRWHWPSSPTPAAEMSCRELMGTCLRQLLRGNCSPGLPACAWTAP